MVGIELRAHAIRSYKHTDTSSDIHILTYISFPGLRAMTPDLLQIKVT